MPRKVSLILTTYNCIQNFRTTMESILQQDYPCIEIVIKDGGSSDGTKELIEDYAERFANQIIWKSESDLGLYDAMNQGFLMSTGDMIVFFNDKFLNSHAVSDIVQTIETAGKECIGVHADLVYMDGNKVIREWRMGQGYFRQGWMPGHPTLYLKREIYEQYGLYDISYKCSADYEFMIRALYGKEDRLAYLPEKIVSMYYGGTSTQGLRSYLVSLKEAHRALKSNGIKGACWISIKRASKVLGQFVSMQRNQICD